MAKTMLEVGDRIRVKTWFSNSIVTITRVTKTKAIADIKRKDGTKYTYGFKRECSDGHVRPFSYIPFDTTERTLL